MGNFDTTRRDLIKQIISGALFAAAPLGTTNLEPRNRLLHAINKPFDIDQATLTHYTKITEGCWHLTNGSELALIEHVLPTYLPQLTELAHQPSKHQATVLELTTQGYLLGGLVALDQFNLPEMGRYSQLAVQHGERFSELSHDYNLQAAALKQQATMFLISKNTAQALLTYEKTLPFINQVSPLLRSRVYQGLAGAYARRGREKEALYYIGKAQEAFPDLFEKDPTFLYADSGLSVLHMYEGLMYLDLDQPENAWNAFTQVIDEEALQPKIAIGELTHLEFINLLGKAAVALRDQDRSRSYVKAAVDRAKALDSKWGHEEAWDVYQQAKLVWPGDSQIKGLAEHFW